MQDKRYPVAVAAHARSKGFDGIRDPEQIKEAYTIYSIHDAVNRIYPTDAHFVTYVIDNAEKQPRINKAGLGKYGKQARIYLLVADVDNPGHAKWDETLLARSREQHATIPELQTCGYYYTAHGQRLLQPLERPVLADQAEPYIIAWLDKLQDAGIEPDTACRDWTRHYRLANVIREGRAYRSPLIDLSKMQEISIESLGEIRQSEASGFAKLTRRNKPVADISQIVWSESTPDKYRALVERVAKIVRTIESEWHTLFLALAGHMLSCNVPPEDIVAINRAISIATGRDTRIEDRETAAKTTVQKWLTDQPVSGSMHLRAINTRLVEVISEETAIGIRATMIQKSRAIDAETNKKTLKQVTEEMTDGIRNHKKNVLLVSTECGTGKTHAAMDVCMERAGMKCKKEGSNRSPHGSKSAIIANTNALAEQCFAHVSGKIGEAKRIYGPLSHKNVEGEYTCKYKANADPLVAGGQSLQFLFCQGSGLSKCTEYHRCEARLGYEGDEGARFAVTNHALLAQALDHVGETGLLVIDEPPDLVQDHVFTEKTFALLIEVWGCFEPDFTASMEPAIRAIHRWMQDSSSGDMAKIVDAVQSKQDTLPEPMLEKARKATGEDYVNAIDLARHAPMPDTPTPGNTPGMTMDAIINARKNKTIAKKLGDASRAYTILHYALSTSDQVVLSISQRGKEKELHITHINRDYLNAIKREGPTVVLGADIDIAAEIYEKALGYTPELLHFGAKDGAPVERMHVYCSKASRKHWCSEAGYTRYDPSLSQAIAYGLELAGEPGSGKVALMSLLPIRRMLDCILHPDDADLEREYLGKLGERSLEAARLALGRYRDDVGTLISDWGGSLVLGHYGALRGLNSMSDCVVSITVGDPWQNMGKVARDVALLDLSQGFDERIEELCGSELQQAHGRLRTIHRTTPCKQIHLGRVLPRGSLWRNGNTRNLQMPKGRPVRKDAPTPETIAALVETLGGQRKAARLVGCSQPYLAQCIAGTRTISLEIWEKLRRG